MNYCSYNCWSLFYQDVKKVTNNTINQSWSSIWYIVYFWDCKNLFAMYLPIILWLRWMFWWLHHISSPSYKSLPTESPMNETDRCVEQPPECWWPKNICEVCLILWIVLQHISTHELSIKLKNFNDLTMNGKNHLEKMPHFYIITDLIGLKSCWSDHKIFIAGRLEEFFNGIATTFHAMPVQVVE